MKSLLYGVFALLAVIFACSDYEKSYDEEEPQQILYAVLTVFWIVVFSLTASLFACSLL